MRETSEIEPRPETPEEILRLGIHEIATMAPGGHQTDPCYGARREISAYASRILEEARSKS